jgi:predicted RNA binding protein YcfA (HicA-like mRNA interferase family)
MLEHPTKSGLVVIPAHTGRTIRLGTLANVLEDAGLSVEDLRRLL